MAFQLEWTIDGEKQLSRVLIGMESSLKDYTYPFRQSADYLKRVFSRDVFESQGAAIGEMVVEDDVGDVVPVEEIGFDVVAIAMAADEAFAGVAFEGGHFGEGFSAGAFVGSTEGGRARATARSCGVVC